jgi:hypothetical protein
MRRVAIPLPPELDHVLQAVLERDPEQGTAWLRVGCEARLAELDQPWQTLQISTACFVELLGVSPWELDGVLHTRGFTVTHLPGEVRAVGVVSVFACLRVMLWDMTFPSPRPVCRGV